MKVKDLLNKYNGEFTIFGNVPDTSGRFKELQIVATNHTQKRNPRAWNKILEREVHDFAAGKFILDIYLDDEETAE